MASGVKGKFQKSYFDVLGLCCSSEIPLIEKIMNSLDGVKDFSVVISTKTVIVVHDPLVISQVQIANALNQARLEANVRIHGETSYKHKWPSPYVLACGLLLALSFLKYVYSPLLWLAVGSVAVGIIPVLLKSLAALRNRRLDINVLVVIAVVGSIGLQDYWEAAAIVFLFTISEWLESKASHKATAVMTSLISVVPQTAVLADTGEEINADEVKLHTILAVKPGEVIPIDGIVVHGNCEVDEKILTGESFPVPKEIDSTVWASTINLNGYVSIKTTAVAEDCVVARMAKIVEEAHNNKSRTQRFIDKCAKYYTPAIVMVSACLAIVPFAFRVHNKSEWFHLALVVLVSGCPCALLLSTPVAMFCALSKAATLGILFKGAEHLETLARIKIMAFDKTGTITRGEFEVVDFKSLLDDLSSNTLLYWISSIESRSSHPMAAALVDFARAREVAPKPENVENFQNFPGEGISGKIEGKEIYIGNSKIATRAGCAAVPQLEGYSIEGKSVGYIFLGSSPIGIFYLSDVCRTGAMEALVELKSLGIKTVLLTGDCHGAAQRAQEQLGGALDVVHAGLLPEDKARIVKELQEQGCTGMIGDGLNDAPALATADIGISMGVSGSALATESGDVVLMTNDIQRIPMASRIARRVRRKIIENVIISISTKTAIVALAIAGHPLVWAAVLADVGTCLLVILNSMLLLRGTCRHGKKCCANKSHSSAKRKQHGHSHNSRCCSDLEAQNKCSSDLRPCSSNKCSNEHSHNHDHGHNHKCNHDHDQNHDDHGHSHDHNTGHDHGHSHDHNNHNHECNHDHDPDHDHNHDHEHDHNHNHNHNHDHDMHCHSKKITSSNSHSCCEELVQLVVPQTTHSHCNDNHCGDHENVDFKGTNEEEHNKCSPEISRIVEEQHTGEGFTAAVTCSEQCGDDRRSSSWCKISEECNNNNNVGKKAYVGTVDGGCRRDSCRRECCVRDRRHFGGGGGLMMIRGGGLSEIVID